MEREPGGGFEWKSEEDQGNKKMQMNEIVNRIGKRRKLGHYGPEQ